MVRCEQRKGLSAEVGGFELRVGAEFRARALADDMAGFQDVAVGGDFQGEIGVLLDEQDGDALGAVDLHDLFKNRGDEARGDAERGFVEHQEFRAAHERAADGEHLLFAAGERAGGLLEALFQAGEEREDVFASLGDGSLVVLQEGAHGEIFGDGEVAKNHAALGDVAESAGDDLVRRQAGDVLAAEGDAAAFRADQAGEGVQRGGLARSVAAEERDNRALRNLKGDAAQRVDGTVADGEI